MSIQSYQDTLGKAGKLPQQITDATHSISEGAKKVHDMTTKIDAALKQIPTYNPVSGAVIGGLSKAAGALDNAAAKAERAAQAIDKAGNKIATTISPISKAAQSVRQSLTDLQNCKAVLNASSLVVDAAVNSVTGHFHPRANEKAFANFDTTWDSWARMVNTTYGKLYPAGQKDILEKLARANFGDNVYALGSAIKNESAGIFGGIADFEDAIHAFRGSYRNPIEAAKKIEAGVKGIINATERVANSINGMVKAYQSKGGKIKGEMPGNPILSYIGNLHNTKAISAINKTLTIGGGAATLWTDGVGIKNAVGSGDIKKIYSAGKKTVDDAKAIVKGLKNNNNATRSTTPSTSQAAQKQSSNSESQKQANNNQQNGQHNNSQDNNQQVGGGDSYVCSGATMRCSMGTNLAKLTVLPSRTVFLTGQPMANISDHLSMVNLAPFGRCRSLGFPATASATAANHGSLTPMPCMHNTPFPWMRGKDDYIVKGDPAMLKSSTCSCMWGGTISVVEDGQMESGLIDLSRIKRETTEKKQVPFRRQLKSTYQPFFVINKELTGERATRAEQEFQKQLELFSESTKMSSNWLGNPIPREGKLARCQAEENTSNNDGLSNDVNEDDAPVLHGYISYNDNPPSSEEFAIEELEHSTSCFRELGQLSLSIFDCIPLIRNTKATITITIDAFVAGLSIGLSVGVDNDLRRYIQLNLDSWVGGDYSDLVNYRDIQQNKRLPNKRLYKKQLKKLAKKFGKRLCVVRITPSYKTGVSQPEYFFNIEGAYVDLDLQFDKLIEINIGTEKVTNISDIIQKGYAKISGAIKLPSFDLKYGWESNKLDTNAGFYIEITPKMKEIIYKNDFSIETPDVLKSDDRLTGLSQLKKKENNEKSGKWGKGIYQQSESCNKIVGKIGSRYSYTWQLENILEKRSDLTN